MKRYKGIINIAVYFIFQIFVGMGLFFALMIANPEVSSDTLENKLFSVEFLGVITTGSLLFIFLINFRVLTDKIKDGFDRFKETIAYGFGGYGILLFSIIALNLLLTIFNVEQVNADNEESVQQIIDSAPLLSSFIIIGVVAPFLEEIVFRTSFMAIFTEDKPSKKWWPYILCAIIFSLIHDQTIITAFSASSVATFLTYLLPSLALSLTYRFSKHNLLAVFLVHFLNNSLPFLFLIMGASQ